MGGGTVSRRVRRLARPSLQPARWTGHFRSATLSRPTRVDANEVRDRPRSATPPTRPSLDSDEPPRAHAPRPPRPAQFDGKPFNKGSMAASVIATVAGGAGVICFAAFFQNKKHGFIK